MKKVGTVDFLAELALIVRGKHPAWEGDSCMNADSFVKRFARDFPEDASNILNDINSNLSAASEVSGLPPRRLLISTKTLRDANAPVEDFEQ